MIQSKEETPPNLPSRTLHPDNDRLCRYGSIVQGGQMHLEACLLPHPKGEGVRDIGDAYIIGQPS